MKTTQEKSKYERPVMQVFELRHEGHLLTLSNPGDYTDGGDPFSSGSPSLILDEDLFILESIK
jgi:hypothetical protein